MQTQIVPVAVWPATANTLYIRSITLGPPPSYYYELQDVTVTPGTSEQRDPTTGDIIVPATPDTITTVMLKNGNVDMTETQWDNWQAGPASGDDDYQLNCISANLGLTRV